MAEVSFYEILGVSPDADADALKKGYRQASLRTHPDAGGTDGMFTLVQQAWATLSDDDQRAAYDRRRPARPGPQAPTNGPANPATGPTSALLVDPARLSWTLGLDPAAPVVVTPSPPRWLRILRPIGWALTLASGAAIAHHVYPVDLVTAGVVTIATVLRFAGALARQPVVAPLAVAGVAGVLLTSSAAFGTAIGWVWVWLVVAALDVAWDVLGEQLIRADLDAEVPVAAARDGRVFGARGMPVRGFQNPEAAAAARVAADAVEMLLLIPSVRLFYRVAAGAVGLHGADIVALRGRKLAVFTALTVPAGRCSWDGVGNLLANGMHFPGGDVTDSVRDRVWAGAGLEVRNFVVLVANGASVSVDQSRAPHLVRAGVPHDVIEEAGRWLRDGDDFVVDRDAMVVLGRGLLPHPINQPHPAAMRNRKAYR